MSDLYKDPGLYDALFAPEPFAGFYSSVAAETSGPILELACGTGQMLRSLADTGFQCTGLDRSSL